MATTEVSWPVRALGPTDLGVAAALAAEAGWNQVDADWRIFLELGHLMGIDVPGHGVVATAATLPLGHDLGWIGMMLVATPFRRAARDGCRLLRADRCVEFHHGP